MSRLLLLLVVNVVVVAGQSCTPNCTNYLPGTMVPDPKNCYKYYVCTSDGEPSDVSFQCLEGEKFDSEILTCLPDDGSLDIVCEFCESPTCQFQCPPDGGVTLVADFTYCNRYYECGTSPEPMELYCKPGNYFDGENCQEDPTLCCDACEAYCYEAFTEVANPTNCNNFYFCTDDKYYPEANDLVSCPSGKTFDVPKGHCSAFAECHQPCA